MRLLRFLLVLLVALGIAGSHASAQELGPFAGKTAHVTYSMDGSSWSTEARFGKNLAFVSMAGASTGVVCSYGRQPRVDVHECRESNPRSCGGYFGDLDGLGNDWILYRAEIACRVEIVGDRACIISTQKLRMERADYANSDDVDFRECISLRPDGGCSAEQELKMTSTLNPPFESTLTATKCAAQ